MAPPKVDSAARVLPKPIEPANGKNEKKPNAEIKGPVGTVEAPAPIVKTPTEAESSFGDDVARWGHLQIDGAYALSGFMDLSNDEIDPTYSGDGGDLKIKWMYDVNPYFSVGGGYSHAWRSMGMEDGGYKSTLNKSTWGLGPVANIEIVPDWLRLSLDFYFGQSTVDSGEESSDGVNGGGAIYAGNSLKYNVDDVSAFAFQFNACLASPELGGWDYFGIGLQACYGVTQSKHDFTPDALDRSTDDSPQGASTTDHAFMGGLTIRIGKNAELSRYRAEAAIEEKREGSEEKKMVKPEEKAKTQAPAAAGPLKPEVQTALDQATAISKEVATALAVPHGENIKQLAAGIKAEDASDAFSRAKDILEEYKASISVLQKIASQLKALENRLTTEPLKSMSEADKKPAIVALAQVNADVEKLFNSVKSNKAATIAAIQTVQSLEGLSTARRNWCEKALVSLGVGKARPNKVVKKDDSPQSVPPTDNKCPDGYVPTAVDGDKIGMCTQAQ